MAIERKTAATLRMFLGCILIPWVCACEDGDSKPVIFEVNFDDASVGAYTTGKLAEDWNSPPWNRGISNGRVTVIDGSDAYKGKSLRISYPTGAVGMSSGGAGWRTQIGSYDTLSFSYRVRFKPGFDFVRGGKLPGLGGGKANTGGGRPNGSDGWSVRFMWRENGILSAYVYHPDQPSNYGEHFNATKSFTTGKWHKIEMRVTLNTPGQRDGSIQGWLNGSKVIDVNGLRFRDVSGLTIDQILFETFFGGSSSSYAPTRDETIDFDDFKLQK
jgi:hypothetical protein